MVSNAHSYNILINIAIVIMLIFICSIVFSSIKNKITPMPSNTIMHQAVLNEIKRLKINGNVVDTGSGFGHLLFKLAPKFPHCSFIGIENSTIPFLYSKIISKLLHKRHNPIKLVNDNIYHYNYSSTQLIVCYLYPGGMQKLYEILIAQKIEHIYVISICFAINNLQPQTITQCNDLYRTKVYTYEISHRSSK